MPRLLTNIAKRDTNIRRPPTNVLTNDVRLFATLSNGKFARSDFPQSGWSTFRLSREVIQTMLDRVSLSRDDIADAADFSIDF
jgi:hypothetical protein